VCDPASPLQAQEIEMFRHRVEMEASSGRAECFDRTCYNPAAFLPLAGRDLTLIRRILVIISRKNVFSHGRSIDLPERIHNSDLPSACGINTPKWTGFNIF
jgi:hypothetical protein